MICNVLGSGPRRNLYTTNGHTTVGCNIPYAWVSHTVVFDKEVVSMLPQVMLYKLVMHSRAYFHLKHTRPELQNNVDCVFDYNTSGLKLSSGHYAAYFMIQRGYTQLNLYGMDSWFNCEDWNNSYTDTIINKPTGIPKDIGYHWKSSWELMKAQNPNVIFNFI